jgi:hypothetical protein
MPVAIIAVSVELFVTGGVGLSRRARAAGQPLPGCQAGGPGSSAIVPEIASEIVPEIVPEIGAKIGAKIGQAIGLRAAQAPAIRSTCRQIASTLRPSERS